MLLTISGYEKTAVFFVSSGIALTFFVSVGILTGRSQKMRIMNVVWPLTVLWGSWLTWFAYWAFGESKLFRRRTKRISHKSIPYDTADLTPEKVYEEIKETQLLGKEVSEIKAPKPQWQRVTLSTFHCGAGCTLADIIGELFTRYIPISITGSAIAAQWILDYILALIIGVFFQYYAIIQMKQMSFRKGFRMAIKADFFSLTAWQIGMYVWMAIYIWLLNDGILPDKTTWSFWFNMQIAMYCGFITAFPVNIILVRMGIKQAMK